MDDARLLSWIDVGRLVATFMVALGVAGEFAGEYISRPINRRLEEVRKKETAVAQKEAADARLKLDQWLAKKIIARVADPNDFEPLKRFHDVQAEVWYKEGDGEAFIYAQSIRGMLEGIGWKVPKQSIPTRQHPLVGNEGNPIIGTFVLAKRIPHGAEAFEELTLPASERKLPSSLAGAVRGGLAENPSMPDNKFIIVVGEYLRDWMP